MPKPLVAVFTVCLLLVGALFGFTVGAGKGQPRWQQTPATVSTEKQVATFEGASWTYRISHSVPWYDEEGAFHKDGWPACLTDRTTSARILVPGRSIDVDGVDLRPVYAVDCR